MQGELPYCSWDYLISIDKGKLDSKAKELIFFQCTKCCLNQLRCNDIL